MKYLFAIIFASLMFPAQATVPTTEYIVLTFTGLGGDYGPVTNIPNPLEPCLMGVREQFGNPTLNTGAMCLKLRAGLSYDGPNQTLAVTPPTGAQVTSALGYTPMAAPTGTTAQYMRGDGTLATFPAAPTVPTINRARITTATDGTYTWTLPTACASGQLPVVGVTPENSTAGEVINHKLTAVSNTSATIALSRAILTLNGLLGLTIPIIQTSPGAQVVHMTAICP